VVILFHNANLKNIKIKVKIGETFPPKNRKKLNLHEEKIPKFSQLFSQYNDKICQKKNKFHCMPCRMSTSYIP
jgi:hypothetical protein